MRRLFLLLIVLVCLPICALASAPYSTLTEDNDGELLATLDGYIPGGAFDTLDGKRLDNPQDLFIDENDILYIADTGNKRVVACTGEGEFLRAYGEGTLKKPSGVCVRLGRVYVADASRKAVIVFDRETGEEITRYEKPSEPRYGEKVRFEPLKVQADASGILYVISSGNAGGVAMLSPDGAFLGYFGANNASLGLSQVFKRLFYTADMLKSVCMNIPNTPGNLTMDKDGLLYTATPGATGESIKKFNMLGKNLLPALSRLDDNIVDVAVGGQGTFFALNSLGYVYEYTDEGRLLFFFGGEDKSGGRDGLFKNLTSIAVDGTGELYVLDAGKNLVQRLTATRYADEMHAALTLWQDGRYAESLEPWKRVMRSNSQFDLPYVGLGKAYDKLEDYGEAMTAFRLGGDREGYSDAFWEVRAVFLQTYFLWIVLGAVALFALHALVRRLRVPALVRAGVKMANTRAASIARLIGRAPRNPAAAFYAVKCENALSVGAATALYALLFLLYVLGRYATGFLFKQVKDGEFNLAGDAALFFGLLALFLTALSLVCSTRQSEARPRDMYCGLPVALSPVFLIAPVLIVMSYLLTYNERFLMTFGVVLTAFGSLVMVTVMVREMQNYTYGETVRVLLLTLFSMLVIALTLTVVAILVTQLFEFFSSLIREAGYYAQR